MTAHDSFTVTAHRAFRRTGPKTYVCVRCLATVEEWRAGRTAARLSHAYPARAHAITTTAQEETP